jgi:hypothetical protein
MVFIFSRIHLFVIRGKARAKRIQIVESRYNERLNAKPRVLKHCCLAEDRNTIEYIFFYFSSFFIFPSLLK